MNESFEDVPDNFYEVTPDVLSDIVNGKHYTSKELFSVASRMKAVNYLDRVVIARHPETKLCEYISTSSRINSSTGQSQIRLSGSRAFFEDVDKSDRTVSLQTAISQDYTIYIRKEESKPPSSFAPVSATANPTWALQYNND